MGYLNVPANGWPQLRDLEKLDKIAQQIGDLPTFTSDDRAFLEALPAMPTEEGKRVLTATTDDQGGTDLTYETPEVEGADIAPTFSESEAYSAGDLVYHDGTLYKFDSDHAAGAWDSSEVSTTTVDAELSELKNTLSSIINPAPAYTSLANGSKTNAQQMYEIATHISISNVSYNAFLKSGNLIARLISNNGNVLKFVYADISGGNEERIIMYTIGSSNNNVKLISNNVYTDVSGNVAENDISLYY